MVTRKQHKRKERGGRPTGRLRDRRIWGVREGVYRRMVEEWIGVMGWWNREGYAK